LYGNVLIEADIFSMVLRYKRIAEFFTKIHLPNPNANPQYCFSTSFWTRF